LTKQLFAYLYRNCSKPLWMKKYIAISLFFVLLIVGLLSMRKAKATNNVSQQTNVIKEIDEEVAKNQFALVELFTSEGCSSCPSADNLVNATIAENKANVFVLCFHVDYWNRLGWKDMYSDAVYSSRQKEYANALDLEGVYTPQIVVNGKTEFVGSNPTKLSNAIAPKNQAEMQAAIALQTSVKNETIDVQVQTAINTSLTLRIALVQKHASTQVKNGENEGMTLQHSNIVRELKSMSIDKAEMHANFQLPNGLQANDVEIVVFLQDNKSLQIVSVVKSSVQ
jgi:hypothetical protein